MTVSETTTVDQAGSVDTAGAADEHEAHDVTDRQYVIIALLLAVLTAAEVAVSYMDIGALMVPTLLVMMVVKFMTIVGYFMHLKFDAALFKFMFFVGLGLSVFVFGAMLTTFHFFIT